MYVDSAYIAKYYVNEPGAAAVRKLIRRASHICSSSWALIEVTCVFQRHVRGGSLSTGQGHALIETFTTHAEAGLWNLIPVTNALLGKTAIVIQRIASTIPLRAGDAIHLATALDAGETEIWTNDRHLLAAAQAIGIVGKTVSA